MIKKILIGADPELFLKSALEVVSAEGIIGGTKHEPKSISDIGHAIQEDNVMVEYNIPPSKTCSEFIDNHNFVINHIKDIAQLNGLELHIEPSAQLDKKYLNTEQGKTFGCEPDFNVYTKDVNSVESIEGNYRFAGGHIHIGWENPIFKDKEDLVIAMDIVLGLDSVILDTDDKRKQYYGSAGRFRFKDYGIEYRTLSNFWIKSEELMERVYTRTHIACDLVNNGVIDSLSEETKNKIQEAINNSNIELAKELQKQILNKKEKVK